MAEINYTVLQSTLDGVGYENYSAQDRSVVDSFEINSAYDESSNNIELHIYGLNGTLLDSNLNYRGAQQLQGAENGANLSIDPERDALQAGYDQGDVKLLYNFLSNISPEEFFIQEISANRTELRVLPVSPTFDATALVNEIKAGISTGAYFNEFRLNFGGNDLLIGLNIDINNSVLVKLYEPLPSAYATKSRFTFDEIVSDSVVFEIQAEFIPDAPVYPTLRGANFNIETGEEKVQPTEYFDYDSLYSFDVTSSLHGVITQLSSSGVELSIDYTDYENFIHFSSAEERVRNFHYKMGLLEQYNYSASISTTYQPQYDNLTKGIISKFDDYEKYLYFKSGSKAWPKSNANIPYINDTVTNSTSWFNEQIASASLYDELNESRLTYTVPEFIREDSSNAPYNLFLDMIGQHFDNLWIYSKAMTDKYDADNRLNVGVSKDLIRDVLKSFGVKLYTSNFSVSNLAASFIGEFYQSGSEQINTFVTASNDPTPDKDILSETYKRIYHNLPYLIKTKGTERGLRALINCFGIPSGSLEITEVGGYKKDDYFFNRTETIDKIRLDNTGSLVNGSTLSQYVSIQNNDEKYTQDSHQIDVAFTPAKYINTHIENQITGSYPSGFNIDEYIGDPTLLSSNSYTDLNKIAETALSGSDRYDMFDFVRLVKFFDNQLFKMVKDFVPARAVTTTGITVKPHILNRSKIAVPTPTWTRPEYSGSIDTAFTTGSEGGVITSTISTAYTASFSTLSGTVDKIINNNSPQFNGELGGTVLTVTTQSLNPGNPLLNIYQPTLNYAINYYNLGNFSESNQFTGSLAAGEIKVGYFEFPRGEGFEDIPYYLRVHNASLDGTGIRDPLRNADLLVIHGYVYEPITTVVDTYGSNGVYITLPTGGSSLPSTNNQASKVLRLKPYVDVNITYHEYNAILNNATDIRKSNVFKQSDRYSGLEPNNITAILTTSASNAEIQDSNYSSKAYTNPRYDGSKHTATALHTQSLDTGLVPISNPQTYFSYFNWLGGTSPNWGNNLNDRVAANIKYVISLDGETITPSNDAEGLNLSLIEQNFKTGEQATISLDSDSNAKFYSLNGTWDIFKSGKRIEPIIYSQTQSVQANEVTGYGVAERLTFFSSNVPNSDVASDMRFDATLEGGVEIKDSTVPFTVGLIEGFTGTNATLQSVNGNDFANLDPADQNQSFTLIINAKIRVNRTSIYRNTITFEIQKQIDSGPWTAIKEVVLNLQEDKGYGRTVEIEDTINDTTGAKQFKYRVHVVEVDKSSLATAAEIDPEYSYLKISQTPISAIFASASSAYWAVDSTDRTYVSASTGGTGLSTFYNHKQNDIEESGFTEIRYPFTVKEGDEIRFEATENFAYRINEVVREQPQLILKLDREVPEGINTNMFLVRRYVDDPSSIILDVDKPAGGTSGGILKPEFMPSGSERQLQKVVQTLRRQNQI